MTSTRTHLCVFFDDGGPEHLCVCGSRALLLEEEGVLVMLMEEPTTTVTSLPTPRRERELAVSA